MSNPDAAAKKKIPEWAPVLVAGLLGMLCVVWPQVGGGRTPSDLADGRLNAWLLEHFHRWITGREPVGFWDARFFYPFPLVTAFSDNFLGSGPVYSLLRMCGLDMIDAYRWWFLAGYATNYAACALVLARFRLRGLAVAAGAFIFTFNMAVTEHSGHEQLVYRCGVPLAVWFFHRALQGRRLADWPLCFFWVVWQFYASIYIGVFLVMLLAAFGLGVAVCNVPRRLRAGETAGEIFARLVFMRPLAAAWREAGAACRIASVAATAGLAVAMELLFHPYTRAVALYDFQRPWSIMRMMLPRVWSYFYAPTSRIWPHNLAIFNGLSLANEHAMFTGAGVWALFAAALWLLWRTRAGVPAAEMGPAAEMRRPFLLPLLFALAFLAGLTVIVFNITAYRLVYALPGLEAVRAVARVIMVMVFPLGVLCAFGIDALLRRAGGAQGGRVRAFLAVALAALALEAALITHNGATRQEWEARLSTMQAAISAMHLPADQVDGPILFVPPAQSDVPFYFYELDGMMLAQQSGLATLNGYSGNIPPGVLVKPDSIGAVNRIAAYSQFAGNVDEAQARALAARVLVWNGAAFEPMRWEGLPEPYAGRLPQEMIAQIRLGAVALHLENGRLVSTLHVENPSALRIPAVSATGMDVSFTWAFVPVGRDVLSPDVKWDGRSGLENDVPPGGSDAIVVKRMTLPQKPGDYDVWFSMLQENVDFFHNAGMKPALGDGIVRVKADGTAELLPRAK